MKARTIAVGEFKAKCLGVIKEVRKKRHSYVITHRGEPVAELIPLKKKQDDLFGCMKGKVKIKGDIVKPALSLREWGKLA